MSVDVVRGEAFEACAETGITGLVGTIEWQLIDNDGGVAFSPTTADIIETPAGSGVYCINRDAAPLVIGHYTMIWSTDGTFDENSVLIEDLIVHSTAGSIDFGPLLPADVDAPIAGPCGAWTTVEDIADCCSVTVGSDVDLFEEAAVAATQVLYEKSARRFNPGCERVVRPSSDFPCGVQVLSRGHIVTYDGSEWSDGLDRVLLPNYPVTEIVEVRVGSETLDADEYRLDGWRYLTRMADADGDAQSWPSLNRHDRPDGSEHTFTVRYLFGQNPPAIGSMAAAQLACEIYKACPGNEGVGGGACKIPKNAVRVTRNGVTIEMSALAYDFDKRRWSTGMELVDLFLNTYNPYGLRRAPLIWSPDAPQHAVELGTALGS